MVLLRMPHCRACQASTCGNCGNHEPSENHVPGELELIPYLCPVCQGRGKVRGDFYSFVPLGYMIHPIKCQSCEGSGVLWRP